MQRQTQSKTAEGAAFDALSHDQQRRTIDTDSDGSILVSISGSICVSAKGQRYRIRRLEAFDSAARADDFDPVSNDVDFVVEPGAVRNLYVLASVDRNRNCERASSRTPGSIDGSASLNLQTKLFPIVDKTAIL